MSFSAPVMHALWLDDQHLSFLKNVPIPIPSHDEALIQVLLGGVCSTDLELVHGYYPFSGIPGHEFVGKVVSSPGDPSWINKRVVGEINIACGKCDTCRSGLTRHCERRKTLGIHAWNGAFAEYLVLPLANLHSVPEHVPDDIAVFTEPLAAACEILEQTHIRSKDRVLVIGAGRLGQLVAWVLQSTGCALEVIARHPHQQELLVKRGIQTVSEDNIDTGKYDLVVETTGSPAGFALASQYIRPRGTIILKSTYNGLTEVDFSALVVNEITVIGSRCGPFEPAIKLLFNGVIDPNPLIDAVYPLDRGLEAFEHAARAGALKIILQPPSTAYAT